MALSRTHWTWLRELVVEWREATSNGSDFLDGKAEGYREAAEELEETLDAIQSYYF